MKFKKSTIDITIRSRARGRRFSSSKEISHHLLYIENKGNIIDEVEKKRHKKKGLKLDPN